MSTWEGPARESDTSTPRGPVTSAPDRGPAVPPSSFQLTCCMRGSFHSRSPTGSGRCRWAPCGGRHSADQDPVPANALPTKFLQRPVSRRHGSTKQISRNSR